MMGSKCFGFVLKPTDNSKGGYYGPDFFTSFFNFRGSTSPEYPVGEKFKILLPAWFYKSVYKAKVEALVYSLDKGICKCIGYFESKIPLSLFITPLERPFFFSSNSPMIFCFMKVSMSPTL